MYNHANKFHLLFIHLFKLSFSLDFGLKVNIFFLPFHIFILSFLVYFFWLIQPLLSKSFSASLCSLHKSRIASLRETKRKQSKMASLESLMLEGLEVIRESVAPSTKIQVRANIILL